MCKKIKRIRVPSSRTRVTVVSEPGAYVRAGCLCRAQRLGSPYNSGVSDLGG